MKLIAHRNETPGCPENSVASLEYSAQKGIYAVECDVRRTGDGEYVIYHDETLLRLAGADVPVDYVSLNEMRDLLAKVGRTVITLDQLTALYSADAPILLHIKERTAWPDLISRLREAKDLFIYGVESVEVLDALKSCTTPDRILAFLPVPGLYPAFIAHGAGIIRLWENWLDEYTPDMVHAAGAEQVWIMCNSRETGMNGNPDSLNRLQAMGADGALVSDVKMAVQWLAEQAASAQP